MSFTFKLQLDQWAGMLKFYMGYLKLLSRGYMYLINIDKCSMLEQTQSQPNHTSKTKVYLNEFVANVLRDKIG